MYDTLSSVSCAMNDCKSLFMTNLFVKILNWLSLSMAAGIKKCKSLFSINLLEVFPNRQCSYVCAYTYFKADKVVKNKQMNTTKYSNKRECEKKNFARVCTQISQSIFKFANSNKITNYFFAFFCIFLHFFS